MSGGYYDNYVSMAEKKEAAALALAKLQKKNKNLRPVIITAGRKIAASWWAIMWNKNLERYADYDNRVGRGRSYVRNGMVLDLQITTGLVTAMVKGSRAKPYEIRIEIAPLPPEKWQRIVAKCSNQISSMEELAAGKFPKVLGELFFDRTDGLFPTPKEIKFSCSCPDWAYMCKHVAAALYGIGARFDQEPLVFFKLRNLEFEEILKKSVEKKMDSLIANAGRKTLRTMEDAAVNQLFGGFIDAP